MSKTCQLQLSTGGSPTSEKAKLLLFTAQSHKETPQSLQVNTFPQTLIRLFPRLLHRLVSIRPQTQDWTLAAMDEEHRGSQRAVPQPPDLPVPLIQSGTPDRPHRPHRHYPGTTKPAGSHTPLHHKPAAGTLGCWRPGCGAAGPRGRGRRVIQGMSSGSGRTVC